MLSIIVPVKEPEPYLPKLLSEIKSNVYFEHEVLVQREKGLGYAVMCGVVNAKGDVVCVLDADGSHPVTAIPGMVALIGEFDIVVGSRYVTGGCTEDSFVRQVISRFFCLFAKTILGLKVKDCMSGFIVAKRCVFFEYPIGVRGFKFGLELLVNSKRRFNVVEYPICFSCRKEGVSKASPFEAINTFNVILKTFKNNI